MLKPLAGPLSPGALQVMYFYYTCSGIGIKLAFFRIFITSMQIAQFVTGMSYLWVVYAGAVLPPGACSTPGQTFAFTFQFAYVGIVLCLFSHFYYNEYVNKKTKSKDARKEGGGKKD